MDKGRHLVANRDIPAGEIIAIRKLSLSFGPQKECEMDIAFHNNAMHYITVDFTFDTE